MLVPMATERLGTDRQLMTVLFGVLGFISTVGVGCLIAAAFSDRGTLADPPVR
jgi:hypothetical protein